MKKMRISIVLALAALLLISTASCHGDSDKDLGSARDPLKVGFMPAPDESITKENAEIVTKRLERLGVLTAEPVVADDYITLIDGLASKSIDVAFINSLGYLLARDWGKAKAEFQFKGADGKTEYRTAIITRSDSGIGSLKDLNGRSFAYTDPYSMSGYLMPLALLTEKGIRPSSTTFAGSFNDLIEDVYNGRVDAGAIYYCERDPYGRIYDARAQLVEKYNDMIDRVVIIELTDATPTTPIVFRRGLPPELEKELKTAFGRLGKDPEAMAALNKLYGATGIVVASDEGYNKIEDVLKKLGKETKEVVPGAVTFYQKHFWGHAPVY